MKIQVFGCTHFKDALSDNLAENLEWYNLKRTFFINPHPHAFILSVYDELGYS